MFNKDSKQVKIVIDNVQNVVADHDNKIEKVVTSPQVVPSHETTEYAKDWSYWKVTFRFLQRGIPFALTQCAFEVKDVGAGIILSNLGIEYLSASALIIVIKRLFMSTPISATYAIGKEYGDNDDNEQVGVITRHGLAFSLALSVPSVAMVLASKPILLLLKQNENISNIVQDFYFGSAAGMPFMFFSYGLQQFTLCIKAQNITLIANIVDAVITLGLGYLLTFGCKPLYIPKLEAKGMGYAYSIANFLATGGTTLVLLVGYKWIKKYKLFKFGKINCDSFKLIWRFIKLGMPFCFQLGSDFLLNYVFAIFIGRLGNDELAVTRVADILYLPIFIFATRTSQSTCFITARAAAHNNAKLVSRALRSNIFVLQLGNLVLAVIPCVLPKLCLRPFLDVDDPKNATIVDMSRSIFCLYPVGMAAEVLRYACGGSLRGLNDTVTSLLNSMFSMNVVGLSIIGGAYFIGGELWGLYIAKNVVLVISATSMAYQWWRVKGNYFAGVPGIFSRMYNTCKSCLFFSSVSTSQRRETLFKETRSKIVKSGFEHSSACVEQNPVSSSSVQSNCFSRVLGFMKRTFWGSNVSYSGENNPPINGNNMLSNRNLITKK